MIKFSVLGSGSKGNSTYIEIDGRGILVDAGFTKKELEKRLNTINRSFSDVQAIYISHLHSDHIKKSMENCPLITDRLPEWATRFLLSHDEECHGYTFQDKAGSKIAIVPDTGVVPEEAIGHLFDCSAIVIETNYDIDLLVNGVYPIERLERIASEEGHYRNECAAEVIEMVACDKLQYVIGFHLSGNNNHPDLAKDALQAAVKDKKVEVLISDQKEPTKFMVVV